MDENIASLVRERNVAALAGMLRRGELMRLTEEERHELPCLAAAQGRLDVLELICTRSHALSLWPDAQGRTALHAACAAGAADVARYAVETLGMSPLLGDGEGITPLELAFRAPKPDAYAYLTAELGFGVEDCYRNPVRRGFYPDPSVVRVGEDYYMVNSTFTHLPGLPISHSRDLVHWETIGHAVTSLEASGLAGLPGGYGYWAPDISYHNGRFWVVSTLRRDSEPFRLQLICSAPRPEGPYDAPRFLDMDGIDPSLFTDVDGQRYIVVNPGVQLAPISEDGCLLDAPRMLYFGSSRIKSEGPHLLHKDGWYYIFQAEGGTGEHHTVTVARSKALRGRYTPCPFNPVLSRQSDANPIGRSGHGKPFATPQGDWYMVYLCGRLVEGCTVMGRETALDPMTWTADGWPMVNALQGPSCLQRRPALPCAPCAEPPLDPALGTSEWISPRQLPAAFARMAGDTLLLTAVGDPATLAPSGMLLRRQSESCFMQEAEVDASDLDTGEAAGLTGYYDERSFFLLGVRVTNAGCAVVLQEQVGDEMRESVLVPLTGRSAALRVIAHGLTRQAFVREADAWRPLCELRADYLSDEGVKGGKRFTGATAGLFALGHGGTARFTQVKLDFCENEAALQRLQYS